MTERQYRQVLKNGALRGERLFETAACATFLRTTARAVRLRQSAEEVWRHLAEPEWLGCATIAAIHDGVALLECGDAVQRERIRRQAGELLRKMRVKVRGLSGLRVLPPRGTGRADVGD